MFLFLSPLAKRNKINIKGEQNRSQGTASATQTAAEAERLLEAEADAGHSFTRQLRVAFAFKAGFAVLRKVQGSGTGGVSADLPRGASNQATDSDTVCTVVLFLEI